MKMRYLDVTLLFFLLGVTQPRVSFAFSLTDHTLITTQAVTEFNACIPHALSEEDLKVLDRSDLMEDLNLVNKWMWYSHYYRPFEALDLYWRSDSSGRVKDL